MDIPAEALTMYLHIHIQLTTVFQLLVVADPPIQALEFLNTQLVAIRHNSLDIHNQGMAVTLLLRLEGATCPTTSLLTLTSSLVQAMEIAISITLLFIQVVQLLERALERSRALILLMAVELRIMAT